jgi:hypothetical protein
MKKITIIASLLVLFTACQKADIRPRAGYAEPTPELKSISGNDSPNSETPNSIGGQPDSSTPTVDPNNPTGGPNEGEITDPLRKKDQKDNR